MVANSNGGEALTDHRGHLGRAAPVGDMKPSASGSGDSIVSLLVHACGFPIASDGWLFPIGSLGSGNGGLGERVEKLRAKVG